MDVVDVIALMSTSLLKVRFTDFLQQRDATASSSCNLEDAILRTIAVSIFAEFYL